MQISKGRATGSMYIKLCFIFQTELISGKMNKTSFARGSEDILCDNGISLHPLSLEKIIPLIG